MCTANRCRSPMAAAILTQRLAQRGIPATVRSGGFLEAGQPAPPEAGDALSRVGVGGALSPSRMVDPAEVAAADLIVVMEREHLRKVVALDPDAWPKTFTLKDLVRRASAAPRRADQSVADWLTQLHAGRTTTNMMGASRDDDVDDPFGRKAKFYVRTVEELDALVERLLDLTWGTSAT